MSLVRREDDWGVSGPQGPRGRPEEGRAQERCLDEGCSAWVAEGEWIGCHCAQSGCVEGAWQKSSGQALGQLLLQGQVGLGER